ncbi:MAG: zinc-dependent metalloprotease [Rhodothermales bacterium]|nr:zinc-dependent metalloprotease [Rhodothermales bacterium]MBO6781466.1 zinc-dependent metalloprotease [Rhodothermales bacterium]
MKRHLLVLTAMTVAMSSNDSLAQESSASLFEVRVDAFETLGIDQAHRFTRLAQAKNAVSVSVIDLGDWSRVAKKHFFSLSMPDGRRVQVQTRGITEHGAGRMTWQGHIGGDPTLVRLSFDGLEAAGRFWVDDLEYRLESLGGGEMALVKTSVMSPRTSSNQMRTDTKSGHVAAKSASNLLADIEVIDVMVVYTSGADDEPGNILTSIDSFVDELNTALDNAQHLDSTQVRLVHTMEVTKNTSWDISSAVDDLVAGNAPFESVASARTTHGADVVMLIHDDFTGANGWVAENEGDSSEAFGAAELGEAEDNATFAHEFGHIIGGLHDVEWYKDAFGQNWTATTDKHAMLTVAETQGTLMNATARTNRVLKFSDPDDTFANSDPLGGADEDVIQVWRDRRSTVAGFVAAVPEDEDDLTIDLGSDTEMEWHESITFVADPTYDPSEVDCDECTYMWYEKDTPTGTYYDSGVSTQTYYDLFRWTSGHGFGVEVSDGADSVEDYIWVDYCPAPCSGGGPKRGPDSEEAVSPDAFSLELGTAFPNPIQTRTEIPFAIPELSHVSIVVFDLLGRAVTSVVASTLPLGRHSAIWDASEYPPGTYLIRMQAGDRVVSNLVSVVR